MQLTINYFHKLNPDTTGTTGTILCEPKIVPVVSNSFETTRTIGTTGTILCEPGLNRILKCDVFNVELSIEDTSSTLPPRNQEEASQQQKDDGKTLAEVIQPKENALQKASMLYMQLSKDEITIEEVGSAEIFGKMSEKIENERNEMQNWRTAVLWIQYT